jgi:hypothetical protein
VVKVNVVDPDEQFMPDMVAYLKRSIIPIVRRQSYVSRKNLEDMVAANHPPAWLMKKPEQIRRRIVTKAMRRMGNTMYSASAWQLIVAEA